MCSLVPSVFRLMLPLGRFDANSLRSRAGIVIDPSLVTFAPMYSVIATSRFVAASSRRLFSVLSKILLRIGRDVLLLATRDTTASALARFSCVTETFMIVPLLLIYK